MTVGEKLEEIMDWNGLHQNELSELTGISPAMISEYVRGVREPNLPALRKLAAGLDVTLWALLNGEPMAVKDYELTEEERQLVGEYRMLSSASRKFVKTTIQALHEIEHTKNREG